MNKNYEKLCNDFVNKCTKTARLAVNSSHQSIKVTFEVSEAGRSDPKVTTILFPKQLETEQSIEERNKALQEKILFLQKANDDCNKNLQEVSSKLNDLLLMR